MHPFDTLSDYLGAGRMRVVDAQELLQPPTFLPEDRAALTRHLRGAVYLAGYAVECALKAYIITESETETFSEAISARCEAGENLDFHGRRGHNLPLLMRASGLMPAVEMDPVLLRAWQYCLNWGPDERYKRLWTGRMDARQRVMAMARVSEWIDEQRKTIGREP
jgi:hypothetical protein